MLAADSDDQANEDFPLRQLSCKKCGNVRHVLVDGIVIGDRLLEGVMFQVSITKTGELEVIAEAEDVDYLKRFDSEYIFREIRRYVEESTCPIGECLHCKEEVTFEDASQRNRPYPWKCPECRKETVWPHPEDDVTEGDGTIKCSMCGNCDEKIFST